MTDHEDFLQELDRRLQAFFADQHAGLDIPPAVLFRLEGAMDTAVKLGVIGEPALRERLLALAAEYLEEPLQAIYRQDERLLLHLHMCEAPVYPGGSH